MLKLKQTHHLKWLHPNLLVYSSFSSDSIKYVLPPLETFFDEVKATKTSSSMVVTANLKADAFALDTGHNLKYLIQIDGKAKTLNEYRTRNNYFTD